MAHISRYPFIRHLRGTPTANVVVMRRGKVRRSGPGLSFWFRPLSAVISEVPIDDRELPTAFHARTSDFQDVLVQATVTYRVTDPVLASMRLDFSIDPERGNWRGTPLEQLAGLLTESAQQHALDLVAQTTLAALLAGGMAAVRATVTAGLAGDQRLAETGLAVIGVRVTGISPEEDVAKALQTPTRERIQQDADGATYERRALAVERERTISENELQSQIELAKRQELLVAQQGANARRQAEEAAAADKIATAATADRDTTLAKARAASITVVGEATASAEAAKIAAYKGVPGETLIGIAARELAGSLPQIGNLVLSPDLLSPVLARLAGTEGAKPIPRVTSAPAARASTGKPPAEPAPQEGTASA